MEFPFFSFITHTFVWLFHYAFITSLFTRLLHLSSKFVLVAKGLLGSSSSILLWWYLLPPQLPSLSRILSIHLRHYLLDCQCPHDFDFWYLQNMVLVEKKWRSLEANNSRYRISCGSSAANRIISETPNTSGQRVVTCLSDSPNSRYRLESAWGSLRWLQWLEDAKKSGMDEYDVSMPLWTGMIQEPDTRISRESLR